MGPFLDTTKNEKKKKREKSVACRTEAIFLRFQASGGEREASAEREPRATVWTIKKRPSRASKSADGPPVV